MLLLRSGDVMRKGPSRVSRLAVSVGGVQRWACLLRFGMVEVEIEYKTVLPVKASPDDAFALVSDIHRSGMHFPDVSSLEPAKEPGRWTWRIKERGLGPVSLQVQYDAIYEADSDSRTVTWRPPARNGGNMDSYGSWRIEPREDGGTDLHFYARTVAYVPAPQLIRRVVESVARDEMKGLKKKYVEAIQKTLGGPP